jgi:hypothetical protein
MDLVLRALRWFTSLHGLRRGLPVFLDHPTTKTREKGLNVYAQRLVRDPARTNLGAARSDEPFRYSRGSTPVVDVRGRPPDMG